MATACVSCGRELVDGLCPNCDSPTQSRKTSAADAVGEATPATVLESTAPFPELAAYRRLGVLGAGGMGVVYLAFDETLRRQVAVKVTAAHLVQDPRTRQRFLREARSMASVEHANVVRVYSFGESKGRPYLVMEYVRGESLAERIKRGPIPEKEVRQTARQIVLALQAAWQQHLVHRDIKPSNVLLDVDGQARVADFGLAKPLETPETSPELTGTQAVLGTPHYLAPEQARGLAVDFRADVYSLGILLFEMLAGEKPFRASTPFGLLEMHVRQPLPSIRATRPETSEGMERLLRWMTEKDREARPGSYAEILEALDQGSPSLPRPVSTEGTAKPAATVLSPGLRLLAAVVMAAFATGLAVWRMTHWQESVPSAPRGRSAALVLAVTPFYGPDPDSAREGRVLASLVERDLTERFPLGDVRVIGIEETGEPARSHEAARALGQRLGASVVVWGRALTVRGETELQPSFTLVPPPARPAARPMPELLEALRGQPVMALEQQGQALVMSAQPSNPIELRKTSAKGVSDAVLLLAAQHALHNEMAPATSLKVLERTPRTSEALRCRAQALFTQRSDEAAFATLQEALALDPSDRTSQALLGDLYQVAGRFGDAVAAYRQAVGLDGVVPGAGFVQDGLLHVRELAATRRRSHGGLLLPSTGYLIGIDTEKGRVCTRYRLPGALVSVARADDVFSLSYLLTGNTEKTGSIRFVGGRLDRPVFPGSGLRLRRMLELSCDAQAGDVFSSAALRHRPPPSPLTETPPGTPPRTVAQAEAFLRAAGERDPTNVWWPFLLGTALWWQERKDEAGRVWETVFAPDSFPAMPYAEFSEMAARLELLGLREWADRAYASALARRRRLPQPIESTGWVDRFLSAGFVNAMVSESVKTDVERQHVLLERARELTGVNLEADAFAAVAWEAHYRRRGDAAGAARESAWLEQAHRNPLEMSGLASSLDYALYLLVASVVGAWALLLCIVLPRRGESRGWARWGPAAFLARPSREERVTLLAACSLALLTAAWTIPFVVHLGALSEMPFGLHDSLGDEAWNRWFEDRLARADTPAARWASAVAHHLGGDVPRARELYRRLPDDPRARENLAALDRGDLAPPRPLTAPDIHAVTFGSCWRALGTGLAWLALPGVSEPGVGGGLVVLRWAVWPPLLLVAALVASWRSAPRATVRPAEASARETWWVLVVPGAWDARSGRTVRGWLVFLMLAFLVAFAALRAFVVDRGALGPTTHAFFYMSSGSPLPPEGLSPWTQAFGYPHARVFWALLAASAVAVPVLHVLALRARRRRMESGPR